MDPQLASTLAGVNVYLHRDNCKAALEYLEANITPRPDDPYWVVSHRQLKYRSVTSESFDKVFTISIGSEDSGESGESILRLVLDTPNARDDHALVLNALYAAQRYQASEEQQLEFLTQVLPDTLPADAQLTKLEIQLRKIRCRTIARMLAADKKLPDELVRNTIDEIRHGVKKRWWGRKAPAVFACAEHIGRDEISAAQRLVEENALPHGVEVKRLRSTLERYHTPLSAGEEQEIEDQGVFIEQSLKKEFPAIEDQLAQVKKHMSGQEKKLAGRAIKALRTMINTGAVPAIFKQAASDPRRVDLELAMWKVIDQEFGDLTLQSSYELRNNLALLIPPGTRTPRVPRRPSSSPRLSRWSVVLGIAMVIGVPIAAGVAEEGSGPYKPIGWLVYAAVIFLIILAWRGRYTDNDLLETNPRFRRTLLIAHLIPFAVPILGTFHSFGVGHGFLFPVMFIVIWMEIGAMVACSDALKDP